MAIDRIKVAEAAQKFSLKGQYTKAIAELQKIVAEDNNDVRTLQRIAELYLKASNPGDAVRTYAEVALIYEAGGFFAKAVAVYRQVLKLSPDETEAKIRRCTLGSVFPLSLPSIPDATQLKSCQFLRHQARSLSLPRSAKVRVVRRRLD